MKEAIKAGDLIKWDSTHCKGWAIVMARQPGRILVRLRRGPRMWIEEGKVTDVKR